MLIHPLRREEPYGARSHRHPKRQPRSLVQEVLNPFSGHLFAFRGRKADTMKILFRDGNGLCLFTKRPQQGRFIWPSLCEPSGTVTLTPAQLAMLIEGIDWRSPERTWKPAIAG